MKNRYQRLIVDLEVLAPEDSDRESLRQALAREVAQGNVKINLVLGHGFPAKQASPVTPSARTYPKRSG